MRICKEIVINTNHPGSFGWLVSMIFVDEEDPHAFPMSYVRSFNEVDGRPIKNQSDALEALRQLVNKQLKWQKDENEPNS